MARMHPSTSSSPSSQPSAVGTSSNMNPLNLPEILAIVGHYLPLYHPTQCKKYHLRPRPLLSACRVSKHWQRTLLPILWSIYYSPEMYYVPTDIQRAYAHFFRIIIQPPPESLLEMLAQLCQNLQKVVLSSKRNQEISFPACQKIVQRNSTVLRSLVWELGVEQALEVTFLEPFRAEDLQELELAPLNLEEGGSLRELLEPVKGTLRSLTLGFESPSAGARLFPDRFRLNHSHLWESHEEEGSFLLPNLKEIEIHDPIVQVAEGVDCSEILRWCPKVDTIRIRRVSSIQERDALARTLERLTGSTPAQPAFLKIRTLELDDTPKGTMVSMERNGPGLASLIKSCQMGVQELRLTLLQITVPITKAILAMESKRPKQFSQHDPIDQGNYLALERLYVGINFRRTMVSQGAAVVWMGLDNLARILKGCPRLRRFEFKVYFVNTFLWLLDLLLLPSISSHDGADQTVDNVGYDKEDTEAKDSWTNLEGHLGSITAMKSLHLEWTTSLEGKHEYYQHGLTPLRKRKEEGFEVEEREELMVVGKVISGWKLISMGGAREFMPNYCPPCHRSGFAPPVPYISFFADRLRVLSKLQDMVQEGRPWAGVKTLHLNDLVFERHCVAV